MGQQQEKDAINSAKFNAVPLLAALTKSDEPVVQETAAGALWALAEGSQQDQDAIIAAGAVP